MTKTIAFHFLVLTSMCKADADARWRKNASIREDSVDQQPARDPPTAVAAMQPLDCIDFASLTWTAIGLFS